MRELHRNDGLPFSFDPTTVRYYEPHPSGEGTLLRLDPIANPTEIHVQEDYATVAEQVTASDFALSARAFLAEDGADEPF